MVASLVKPLFLPSLLLLHIHLLIPSPSAATYTNHTGALSPAVPCLPDQAAALLQLKSSFSITNESMAAFDSWKASEDCCMWEGVRCGDADGRVTWLDLGGWDLESSRLDTALFKLISLEYLNLGGNDFNVSEIPSIGFERLTRLTHLNLSSCNFAGQVPAHSIGQLTSLVSLDFSFRFEDLEIFDRGYSSQVHNMKQPWQLILPNFTALVANLNRLRELHFSFVDLSNEAAEWCIALAKYTPNLRVLSLPHCGLSSPICRTLSGLRSLIVINLQHNQLTGPVPEFFANFPNLSILQLSYNTYLEGWVSPLIFQNKKLVTIDLHKNHGISGTLPNFTVESCLENLLVGSTNFSGAIPSSIGNLKSLKELDLSARGFSGELPTSITKLRFLKILRVSGLDIVGSIPTWITNLTSLVFLEFSRCGLSGSIPSSIGDMKKLRTLALYSCNFIGKIPPHILNITQLETIFLHSNNFIGTVELSSFWTLQKLFMLNLSDNKLNVIDGENNSSSISFPNIQYLSLASCNITRFPNILRHLNNKNNELSGVDISNNQIQGAIPHWAWEKWTDFDFFFLNLSHNKLTSIGYASFLPIHINFLDFSFNSFEGPIPLPRDSATVLDYSNNRFSSMPSNISTQLGETDFFKASKNNLSGNIPASFCTTNLHFLDLSYNFFSGSIPPCLFEDANALQVLNLKQNKLHRELPHYINESCSLEALDFSDNRIEGNLPRSLASCKNLEVLDIQNNLINDSFPCWMSTLPRLQVLVLKSNKFFGQVTHSVSEVSTCKFPSLRILDLAFNNFSGTLKEEWLTKLKSMMVKFNDTLVMEYKGDGSQVYQINTVLTYKGLAVKISKILRTFVFIDVSNNAFHGSIPKSMGELVLLHTLNMSHNSLTGPIPSQLGRLKQMEALDLSSNELSGLIPQELASLDFLGMLNLSYNQLEGKIPESLHFSLFANSSFLGNDALCGPPLSKGCSNMTLLNVIPSENKFVDVMLFLFSGIGFGLGFAIAIVGAWGIPIRRRPAARQRAL